MKLRWQLLIVSLLTLFLPWAGCQYVKEMESVLQQGHLRSLEATASAAAARIQLDNRLVDQLQAHHVNPDESVFYLHRIAGQIVVDGYSDGWGGLNIARQKLLTVEPSTDDQFHANIRGAFDANHIYAFIHIEDNDIAYHSPQKKLAEIDFISLRLLDENNKQRAFRIYTAAPGRASVVSANSSAPSNREHAIVAYWQEYELGYMVELKIPRALGHLGIGIDCYNSKTQSVLSIGRQAGQVARVINREINFDNALMVFTGNHKRLWMSNNSGWIVARVGRASNQYPAGALERDVFLKRLYRLILGEQSFQTDIDNARDGRIESEEMFTALDGKKAHQWYSREGNYIARLVVPIFNTGEEKRVIGSIVVEQSTDILLDLINSAFGRVLFYSFMATFFAVFCLLAYSSWLSLRIRKLSQAAEQLVDESGRIRTEFVPSKAQDEIGDLSRSYRLLLDRLLRYTQYLESLASKLSHELRTPLAVVKSSVENLEHQSLDESARTYVQRAGEGLHRLSHILNAMSAASRLEQTIQATERECFDLRLLLQELALAYADIYRNHKITLSAQEQDYPLLGAPELIVQMLDKLVDNASDFAPAGTEINIDLRREAKDIFISVINEGPPLPEEHQTQIFDSLFSIREGNIEANREAENEGVHLGLGLYIVRLIVDFHSGFVRAFNQPGGKVVFEVQLDTMEK